jgi:adenosine deaminase
MLTPVALTAAPKILLHDHLDGGLRPRTVIELAAETGYRDLPTTSESDLAAWFHRGADQGSLELYLETFAHTVGVMQTPEALERVAAECAEDLAADGVVYAEVRFAPELHTQRGLSMDEVLSAVLAGFRRSGSSIRVGILVAAIRTAGNALRAAELAVRRRAAGDEDVVGFDIAGAEAGYPASMHEAAFAHLRDRGLPFTIHAGENAGVDSMADALDCGAHRIGHGVRVIDEVGEDGELGPVARRVFDGQVPLELCPTSNVHTGAVAAFAEDPSARLLRLGFMVTLNTDNRLMSDVTLSGELTRAVAAFDLSIDEVEQLAVNAARAAFLPAEEQQRLIDDVITPGYAALRG